LIGKRGISESEISALKIKLETLQTDFGFLKKADLLFQKGDSE
jgi:hypothetical protein